MSNHGTRLGYVVGLLLLVQEIDSWALNRSPNTTLNVPLDAPTTGFAVQEAFGSVNFTRPVAIVAPPGETNRLFIIEKQGIITVITNLAVPTRTVFLDIDARVTGGTSDNSEEGLLGLAFHPDYASNGYFYVFYTGNDSTTSSGRHDILSRFEVSAGNPNQANAGSELKLIRQWDQASNHNGGDLHFGPEGYLYVSLGDEGGADDTYGNSQKIDADFFSGILRIDVDKRVGSISPNTHPASTANYAIPPDNPFIGATSFNGLAVNPGDVRTEFWAIGLRNPWRISFDAATGDLMCGDVGQTAREEIDLITKGGNYGWAYREGTIQRPGSGTPPAGFSSIDPLLDYPRSGTSTYIGNVVIGGITYRGSRIPQLYGAYIFADSGSGNIWAMRHDRTNATQWSWIASQYGISAFGKDPRNGDILMAAQGNNRIRRLVPAGSSGTPLPATLADAGVFSDLETLTANPGIVPYDLNVPFWSDNAIKQRWFSVPDTNQFITFSPDSNWSFPTGTIWVKHFELELTNGVPESRRRLETRLLVKNDLGVHGFTYRWGGSITNATLVSQEGMDESFVIDDGGGILRTQVWHYPSRSECLACHTPSGGYGLGFNSAQLNRVSDMGEGAENQIEALQGAGYFSNAVSNFHLLPVMPALADESISLEHRVRAYLAANCVQCHSPGGNSPALWDARFAMPTAEAGIIEGALINDGGNSSNRVVARGSLQLSEALKRIAMRGPGQMPPLATTVVDAGAVDLLSRWITNDLPQYEFFHEWQVAQFGSTNASGAAADEDFDEDGDPAYLEFLNGTDPKLASSRWRPNQIMTNQSFAVQFQRRHNRGYSVEFTKDLTPSANWTPLDAPENSPTFLAEDQEWQVPDEVSDEEAGFYRVRVFPR